MPCLYKMLPCPHKLLFLHHFNKMKIWTDISNFYAKNPVASMGIFDGVHSGHKYLLQELKDKAKEIKGESVVITFWPHPRFVLGKDALKLRYLNTLEEKTILLETENIDHFVVLKFTKNLAQLSSCEFIREYLINALNIKHLILGFDHKFGKDQQNNLNFLQDCSLSSSFSVSKGSVFEMGDERISSSLIRELLLEGELKKANMYLGYNYFLLGTVVEGNKLGREIGFPTANIKLQDKNKLLPKIGVYAVQLSCDGKIYPGMLNIGFRPTVDSGNHLKSIEVHLFDFSQDIYGKRIAMSFCKRMRDEVKFYIWDELKAQLFKDRKNVRKFLEEMN